jgi:hypothetical protein
VLDNEILANIPPKGHNLAHSVVIQFPVTNFMPDALIAIVKFDEFGVGSRSRPFM